MNGLIHKTAGGHSSYEIYDADQDFIFRFADVLTTQFGFDLTGNRPVVGLDVILWDAQKETVRLTIGWDIWSGAFVFAHCSEGEGYIERIANYFGDSLRHPAVV